MKKTLLLLAFLLGLGAQMNAQYHYYAPWTGDKRWGLTAGGNMNLGRPLLFLSNAQAELTSFSSAPNYTVGLSFTGTKSPDHNGLARARGTEILLSPHRWSCTYTGTDGEEKSFTMAEQCLVFNVTGGLAYYLTDDLHFSLMAGLGAEVRRIQSLSSIPFSMHIPLQLSANYFVSEHLFVSGSVSYALPIPFSLFTDEYELSPTYNSAADYHADFVYDKPHNLSLLFTIGYCFERN